MSNWPVRDRWEYLRNMERHFPIRSGQPIEMAVVILNSFTDFPIKGKEPICRKWNGEFRSEYSDRNMWTTSRGDLEYSGQKKPKRTFPCKFQPKFPESSGIMESTLVQHADWFHSRKTRSLQLFEKTFHHLLSYLVFKQFYNPFFDLVMTLAKRRNIHTYKLYLYTIKISKLTSLWSRVQ